MAQLGVQRRVDCYRSDGVDQDGVAVGLRVDGIAGSDIATCAWAVFHHHALAPLLGQAVADPKGRTEEHTSELQSLMRISYDVFCLKKKNSTSLILLTYRFTFQRFA